MTRGGTQPGGGAGTQPNIRAGPALDKGVLTAAHFERICTARASSDDSDAWCAPQVYCAPLRLAHLLLCKSCCACHKQCGPR